MLPPRSKILQCVDTSGVDHHGTRLYYASRKNSAEQAAFCHTLVMDLQIRYLIKTRTKL